MALVKVKGLISKEISYSDSDKMLTIITEDFGKISVMARNAKKNGTRACYGTQVLTYGEYVLYRGRSSFTLNNCDVITNYYDLALDLVCFTNIAHMLELAEDTCADAALSGQILDLLLYGFKALRKGRSPLLVSSAFAIKLMQITGYPPHVHDCAVCRTTEIDNIYFSFNKCGFVCEVCAESDTEARLINTGTAKAIVYVLCAPKGKVFSFDLSEEVSKRFSDIALRYTSLQLDKNYMKLNMLKDLA